MDKGNRTINYTFFHWGPFLYKTSLTKEEIDLIKKLCSKKSTDYRKNLAGIIKHEHQLDHKKVEPIIFPYLQSYMKAYTEDYQGKPIGNKLELIASWVNYMTKFESNPIHTHDEDISFAIFTQVPKVLMEEHNKHIGNTRPGSINFLNQLEDRPQLIGQHTFFPAVGDFFIFPACLHHSVNSFQSEGERISVSGNFKITDG